MSCGIYILSFTGTHKLYVGQSKNIEVRYKQHCSELERGIHTVKLLKAYEIYGLPTLEIETLCDASMLDEKEAYYINLWNAVDDGFNYSKTPSGGVGNGELNPISKYTDKSILDLVDFILANPELSLVKVSTHTGIGYDTVKNITSGHTYSWLAEVIPDKYYRLQQLKGTRTNRGERQGSSKYTNDSIEKAFKLLLQDITTPNKVIASLCDISETAVQNICAGTRYGWLADKYPEEYKILQASREEKRSYSRSAKARGIEYPPIVSPIDGSVHYVDNVNKFAKANGLDTGSLNRVLNSKAKSTGGWKLA